MGRSKENARQKKTENHYRLVIVKSALKQLSKISEPYNSKIVEKINSLSIDPRPFGVEKLISRDNEYRVRVGVYRIVYSIFDNLLLIEVVDIDHRKQIYR